MSIGKSQRAPYLMRPGGTVSTSAGGARFTLGRDTQEALRAEAEKRGMTFGRLVGTVLDRMVEDDLLRAVLEDD